MPTTRFARRPRSSPPTLAVPALALVLALLLGVPAAALGQEPALPAPAPFGEEAGAGPLRLRVVDVVTGPEATGDVVAASPTNAPPREGITYVLVKLRVRNAGERPVLLDGGDFALVGASGLVRRFVGAQPPDPALGGPLDPGDAQEGWVVLSAPTDETGLLLLYDSLSLPGAWADRALALDEGAARLEAPAPAAPNDAGTDPRTPAGLDTPIVTAEWEIELLEVAEGAAVFDLVDYRTAALGLGDATGQDLDGTAWVALRLRVTNVGGDPAAGPSFLPANAFGLADEVGDPILDALVLTPPRPDGAGAYAPGASREGWVAFDIPPDAPYLVRFLPYPTLAADPDPRYLAFR
ncbi:MAG: DUF4352 domain-containing protein [Chloroflexota bacterium]|nr:DUF4352 domain-containing protein [Chloroflexota bacterium]